MSEERLKIFEKYIHTNACSDEGGWFAFFVRPGESINDAYETAGDIRPYVNGCETEDEAVGLLIELAVTNAIMLHEVGYSD